MLVLQIDLLKKVHFFYNLILPPKCPFFPTPLLHSSLYHLRPFTSNGALVEISPFTSLISLVYFHNIHSCFPTHAESDTVKREALDVTIAEARLQFLCNLGFSTSTQDNDPKLRALIPPFKIQLSAGTVRRPRMY